MEVELEPRAGGAAFDVGREDAMTRQVEAVRVGLEPVPERDARHGEAVARVVEEPAQRVVLLLVDPRHALCDDCTEEHRTEGGAARGEVGVAERDAPGRLVPTRVTDVQLGEDRAHTTSFTTPRFGVSGPHLLWFGDAKSSG